MTVNFRNQLRSTAQAAVGVCFVAGFLGGCTASDAEVAPPVADPYFPAAIEVGPNESQLVILNTNSDLRYDSGTIQFWNLDGVDALVGEILAGGSPAGCMADGRIAGAQHCLTTIDGAPQSFVITSATARVGNFGASLAVQPLDGSAVLRVFATVRGDPSLTYVDFDPATGSSDCSQSAPGELCSQSHRLGGFFGDSDLKTLSREPYGLFVDPILGHGVISHLGGGRVTLFSAPTNGAPPVLVDEMTNLIAALQGREPRAGGVAPRILGDSQGLIYVAGASELSIATVAVMPGPVESDGVPRLRLAAGPVFDLAPRIGSGLTGEMRGIRFRSDGNRAYALARSPVDELVVIDTSLEATGLPRNERTGSIEICAQVNAFALVEKPERTLAYIPCFGIGQVWVIDTGARQIEDIIDVGVGPTSISVAPSRNRVYVSNFGDDTISVIDTTPGSLYENRVVARIGGARRALSTTEEN